MGGSNPAEVTEVRMVAISGKQGVSRNELECLNLDLGGGYTDVYK